MFSELIQGMPVVPENSPLLALGGVQRDSSDRPLRLLQRLTHAVVVCLQIGVPLVLLLFPVLAERVPLTDPGLICTQPEAFLRRWVAHCVFHRWW